MIWVILHCTCTLLILSGLREHCSILVYRDEQLIRQHNSLYSGGESQREASTVTAKVSKRLDAFPLFA